MYIVSWLDILSFYISDSLKNAHQKSFCRNVFFKNVHLLIYLSQFHYFVPFLFVYDELQQLLCFKCGTQKFPFCDLNFVNLKNLLFVYLDVNLPILLASHMFIQDMV